MLVIERAQRVQIAAIMGAAARGDGMAMLCWGQRWRWQRRLGRRPRGFYIHSVNT